jgi:F0F1-type ATP synthase assembly protein I
MTVLATVSSSRWIIYLVIGLVVGFIAYRSSEKFKQANRVTPWHIPSLIWGLIGFISLLLCAILFFIARRTTKPATTASIPESPSIQPPAGWYPDPRSLHEFRFWDGDQWTGRVEDGGVERIAEV